jgi:hypothetical protein
MYESLEQEWESTVKESQQDAVREVLKKDIIAQIVNLISVFHAQKGSSLWWTFLNKNCKTWGHLYVRETISFNALMEHHKPMYESLEQM